MVVYYPMTAVNWLLGGLSCALFLGLGASGIQIDSEVWMMLYSDAAALQIGLYVWNRRHNVSPHEPEGSSGAAGMVMSALSAPIYARSLMDAVLRRKSRFVVTPRGTPRARTGCCPPSASTCSGCSSSAARSPPASSTATPTWRCARGRRWPSS